MKTLLASFLLPGFLLLTGPGQSAQKDDHGPLPAPALPFGVSSEFTERFYPAQDALVQGDFDAARKAMRALPTRHVKVFWDSAKIPRDLRVDWAGSRDDAFVQVAHGIELSFQLTDNKAEADIQFEFEPELGIEPATGRRRAVATFTHNEAGRAPFEAVIGINRGNPSRVATPQEFKNDVEYALGLYLGVVRTKLPDGFMRRTDAPYDGRVMGSTLEWSTIEYNLESTDALRFALKAGRKMVGGHPDSFIEPSSLVPDHAQVQGQPFDFEVQLTNRGTGTLKSRLIPDCGCFSAESPIDVKPGDTGVYHVHMATGEYGGEVRKTLYLLTNDPNRPFIEIPVKVQVQPRYRFLTPSGSVVVVDGESGHLDVILAVEGTPLKLSTLRVEGVSGEVEFEPWSGVLPDPDLNRPAAPRTGYRLTVNVAGNLLPGRQPFALAVETEDPNFPVIRTTLMAQKGIAAIPDQLFLGDLTQPLDAKLLLSRPGRPFRVLKVVSSNPHLKVAETKPGKHADHDLVVRYDGSGTPGDLHTSLLVTTDDPRQRTVKVFVTGTVH
jgi:hypothetical protein